MCRNKEILNKILNKIISKCISSKNVERASRKPLEDIYNKKKRNYWTINNRIYKILLD